MTRKPESDLINSTEAARLLGVSRGTLANLERGTEGIRELHIYGGVLKVYRTSFPRGERRYSRSQIEALLKGRKLG
jgi:transcriptional regulator with XRE-family HTH domain